MYASFGHTLQVNPRVVLEPTSVTSAGAAEFTRLEDGSILESGEGPVSGEGPESCEGPDIDDYVIQAASPLETITGFRLEALKDPGLPQGGPGRASDGTFRLSEFSAGVIKRNDPESGSDIAFRAAMDEDWKRSQSLWPTIDGYPGTYWTSARGKAEDEIQGMVVITYERLALKREDRAV